MELKNDSINSALVSTSLWHSRGLDSKSFLWPELPRILQERKQALQTLKGDVWPRWNAGPWRTGRGYDSGSSKGDKRPSLTEKGRPGCSHLSAQRLHTPECERSSRSFFLHFSPQCLTSQATGCQHSPSAEAALQPPCSEAPASPWWNSPGANLASTGKRCCASLCPWKEWGLGEALHSPVLSRIAEQQLPKPASWTELGLAAYPHESPGCLEAPGAAGPAASHREGKHAPRRRRGPGSRPPCCQASPAERGAPWRQNACGRRYTPVETAPSAERSVTLLIGQRRLFCKDFSFCLLKSGRLEPIQSVLLKWKKKVTVQDVLLAGKTRMKGKWVATIRIICASCL